MTTRMSTGDAPVVRSTIRHLQVPDSARGRNSDIDPVERVDHAACH